MPIIHPSLMSIVAHMRGKCNWRMSSPFIITRWISPMKEGVLMMMNPKLEKIYQKIKLKLYLIVMIKLSYPKLIAKTRITALNNYSKINYCLLKTIIIQEINMYRLSQWTSTLKREKTHFILPILTLELRILIPWIS